MCLDTADADDRNGAAAKPPPKLLPERCELRRVSDLVAYTLHTKPNVAAALDPLPRRLEETAHLREGQAFSQGLVGLAPSTDLAHEAREQCTRLAIIERGAEVTDRVDDRIDPAERVERALPMWKEAALPPPPARAGHQAYHSLISMIVRTRRVTEASAGFSEP